MDRSGDELANYMDRESSIRLIDSQVDKSSNSLSTANEIRYRSAVRIRELLVML